jgi:hypothetical protein
MAKDLIEKPKALDQNQIETEAVEAKTFSKPLMIKKKK